MLDKNERWIWGERIDVSNGMQSYYDNLKHYRKLNEKLGYGKGWHKWELKEYEKQRAEMLSQQRIKNAFGAKYSKGNGYVRNASTKK